MIKRISLVWKRKELSDSTFREIWLGEHVKLAKQMRGLWEYVIDFVEDAPPGAPAGVATLRFESKEALEAAFAQPGMQENLLRTRDLFAERVQVFYVLEQRLVPSETPGMCE